MEDILTFVTQYWFVIIVAVVLAVQVARGIVKEWTTEPVEKNPEPKLPEIGDMFFHEGELWVIVKKHTNVNSDSKKNLFTYECVKDNGKPPRAFISSHMFWIDEWNYGGIVAFRPEDKVATLSDLPENRAE